jgi:predicted peptidase
VNSLLWAALLIPTLGGLHAVAAEDSARAPETGFLDRTLVLHGASHKYQVFVPADWSPARPGPVILFLHGIGERGSDGRLQTQAGLPKAVRAEPSRFPAVIVMPQCPDQRWWTDPEMEELALAALDAAAGEFDADPKRVYLTGLSMGGFGTWDLAARHPGRFAAVVPVCGGIAVPDKLIQEHPEVAPFQRPDAPASYSEAARKLGSTPVWIFHGAADDVVPVEQARKMNEALKASSGEVRYTEYPGIGHNSWDKAYAEPELMAWLLSKSL